MRQDPADFLPRLRIQDDQLLTGRRAIATKEKPPALGPGIRETAVRGEAETDLAQADIAFAAAAAQPLHDGGDDEEEPDHDQDAHRDDGNLQSPQDDRSSMSQDRTRAAEETEIRLRVPDSASGQRCDRFLAEALTDRFPGMSRSRVKALIEAGRLLCDEATLSEPSRKVKGGQALVLSIPSAADTDIKPQALDLPIVYEDEALIVIDKPAGLVVHPGPGNPDSTLVNALIAHCGESLRGIGGERRPGIVHRLDKDTSGLIVVAKTQAAHIALTQQFAERSIERRYLALVWGVPAPASGSVTGNIGRHPRDRQRMAVLAAGGKTAETQYRLISVLTEGAVSLLACRLLTGRTHQIRVHMTRAGHPLLGDPLYGRATPSRRGALSDAADAVLKGFNRQALHAATLGFTHPESGNRHIFRSSLPRDHKSLLDALAGVPFNLYQIDLD